MKRHDDYKNDMFLAFEMLDNCFSYVCSSHDEGDITRQYMGELTEALIIIKNEETLEKFWAYFLKTGVFHDSEGELVEVTADYFVVNTDY